MYSMIELLDRLVAMQKQAVIGSDAVPSYLYAQESFPYWINRWAGLVVEVDNVSEHIVIDRHTVAMRLVIAHYNEGYQGEPESRVYAALPDVLSYFSSNPGLTSLEYPDEADWLVEPQAEIISAPAGLAVFQNSGAGANQVGVEFLIEIPVYREL